MRTKPLGSTCKVYSGPGSRHCHGIITSWTYDPMEKVPATFGGYSERRNANERWPTNLKGLRVVPSLLRQLNLQNVNESQLKKLVRQAKSTLSTINWS